MTIVSTIAALVGAYQKRRSYRHAERLINALPENIQKDIGWPGVARAIDDRPERRASC